jgi:hypothetical protein
MPDRQTKALCLRFVGGNHERSRTAGLRRRLSCSGLPRLVSNSARISESAAPATLSLDCSRASSLGSPQVRIAEQSLRSTWGKSQSSAFTAPLRPVRRRCCTGLLKGVFGAAFFWVGMGQLERRACCQKSNGFQWSTRAFQLIAIDSFWDRSFAS